MLRHVVSDHRRSDGSSRLSGRCEVHPLFAWIIMTRGGMSLMRAMADEVEKTDIPFAGDTLDKWWNGISNGKQIWAS
jgi:hypothetical protein